MRVKTLQVVWHEKEPVCTLDFSSSGILATGGSDKTIKFWEVVTDADGNPSVRFLANHEGLHHAVNAVRFSPCGDLLASGGDGGEVNLWSPPAPGASTVPRPGALTDEDDGGVKGMRWRLAGPALRGHRDDVLDLSWAPDSSALVTGSIENMCLVWDVDARKPMLRLENHTHYVQGVAWDPLGHYLVSQSNDRTCKVYSPRLSAIAAAGRKGGGGGGGAHASAPAPTCASVAKSFSLQTTLKKRAVQPDAAPAGTDVAPPPVGVSANGEHADVAAAAQRGTAATSPTGRTAAPSAASHCMFHDEGMTSFFRRLAWSPDGSFLVAPSGSHKPSASAPPTNATYVFARGEWSAPIAALPSGLKPTVAVRFCPVLFQSTRAGDAAAPVKDAAQQLPALPYRMVLAVATMDSVLLYETEGWSPIAVLGGLHLAAITDLAWAPDGRTLAVSSRDGFCTLATFHAGELGTPIPIPTRGAHAAGAAPTVADPGGVGAADASHGVEAGMAKLPPMVAATAGFAAAARRRAERAAAAAAAAAVVPAAAGTQRDAPTPAPHSHTCAEPQPGGCAVDDVVVVDVAPAPKRITPTPVLQAPKAPAAPHSGTSADVAMGTAQLAPSGAPKRITPVRAEAPGTAAPHATVQPAPQAQPRPLADGLPAAAAPSTRRIAPTPIERAPSLTTAPGCTTGVADAAASGLAKGPRHIAPTAMDAGGAAPPPGGDAVVEVKIGTQGAEQPAKPRRSIAAMAAQAGKAAANGNAATADGNARIIK